MLSLQLATATITAAMLCSPINGQAVESGCIYDYHHYYIAANASDGQYVKFKPCLDCAQNDPSPEILSVIHNSTLDDVKPYWDKQHVILEVSHQ